MIGGPPACSIVARFFWRLTHPVAAESSVAPWQRIIAEAVHWLLYVLVLLATLSGWLFASARGWKISWYFLTPMPMLTAGNGELADMLNGWHENFEWALLVLIALHVASAFVYLFYYRDGVMQRMLSARFRH